MHDRQVKLGFETCLSGVAFDTRAITVASSLFCCGALEVGLGNADCMAFSVEAPAMV
jgi:hypothetical protein